MLRLWLRQERPKYGGSKRVRGRSPLVPLEEATPALSLLGEELEGALLGDVAELAQPAERLLARRRLLLAHDLAPLVLHQILAGQAALGVVGRAVENLRLAADRGHAATHHGLVCRVIRGVHVSTGRADFFQGL